MAIIGKKQKRICQNIKSLGFDIRQHEDKSFKAVMGIRWKDIPSTHEVSDKTHFASFDEAKIGCQGLFDQWRELFIANNVTWGFGDRFDPPGSEQVYH